MTIVKQAERSEELKRQFTLIELLVVIAIIAVLVALLLPALKQARETAKKIVCLSNQRQCGIGLANYGNDYSMVIPSATGYWYEPGPGLQHAPWSLYLYRPSPGPVGNEFQGQPGGYIDNRMVFLCPSTTSYDKVASAKPTSWDYRDMCRSYGMYNMSKSVWKIGDDEKNVYLSVSNASGRSWAFHRLLNAPSPSLWGLLADTSAGGTSLGNLGCSFWARRMSGNENAFWLGHGTGNVLFGDFHAESIDRAGMAKLSNSLNRADDTHGFRKGRTKRGASISL